MKRNIYLDMKPLGEARDLFLGGFDWISLVGTEVLPTAEALGRVTAGPVFAGDSSPSYNAAAMDGFALAARETFGASEEEPLRLEIGSTVHAVNTGQPLPAGCDAVVMIEKIHEPGDGTVELTEASFPWQHVRRVGEDIVAREMILAHHHRLGAADLSALLMACVFRVEVLGRPRVGIIATGSELVDWRDAENEPPRPGRIIETNSVLLEGLVREAGGEARVMPRQPDRHEAIRDAVLEALDAGCHLVLVNAGASAGSEDHTVHVIRELGEVLVHGIAAMPGKPTILGRVSDRPVVGTPGYPVSAWVCFDRFVGPALAMMQGREPPARPTVRATPARSLPSKLGQEEFLRVHLGRVGEQVVAAPLKRGAGTITSLTRADGILRIPAASEGIDEGARVDAELLREPGAVDRTLVICGSHDITLDLVADHIRRIAPGLMVSATNLGSLAGLVAARQGRCHAAGTHLLDPATGTYNVEAVRQHLPDIPVRLVTLANREQGLMVLSGNPRGIRGLEDLARQDVVFVNRQAGSGTRVLLDYHLDRLSIEPLRIQGYDREEYTHMAVAVQVLSGGAHVGLGILAAARALGLDFIPVATERYDLLIPLEHEGDPRVQALLEVLQDPDFRSEVAGLGGYDVSEMGCVIDTA